MRALRVFAAINDGDIAELSRPLCNEGMPSPEPLFRRERTCGQVLGLFSLGLTREFGSEGPCLASSCRRLLP